MDRKKDTAYGINRLESKNARAAIIQKISADFNLMPLVAEAYYKQISTYFEQHADVQLTSGQICYEAVAAEEPAGKHIALAKKISCRLKLNDVEADLEVLATYGLAGLRRHRILRLTQEAYDQEALLSYEDLAVLLTTSPATVKRDIRALKQSGYFVMTRGAKHDMGPGLSHKTQILELYFKAYTFTEIEQKTNHSERAVYRYLRDFTQVATLHHQGFPNAQIRLITHLSDRLIREYLSLYEEYQHTDRMTQLLHPEPEDTKKGGPLMSKPLTRTQINEKKFRRISDKSLRQLLIHRFLNDYGYDKGEVTATAIVDDILKTVEDYFVITLPLEKLATGDQLPDERFLSYGQLVWMAVPIEEHPERGKSIVKTRMKPIILTYLAAEDIESFRNGFTSRQLRINRLVRWCHQAYDQGALLTQLDLAVLLNVCDAVVCDYVNEWQKTTGELLPTRGNIHDLSGAITHKKEIITLYLQGHLTPRIAAKTKHSKEAVDRYIRDYESVKVVRKATADIDKISQITRLSKRVISQYLDLIPQHQLQAIDADLANSDSNDEATHQGEAQ